MRADAQRNRDLLVAAAAQVFAERGADAPLDDVARRAGVGNATLYRHFPTRSDLLLAVYADEVSQLCASAETLREEASSPREALHEWLRLFMDHVEGKRDLALADTAQVAERRDLTLTDTAQVVGRRDLALAEAAQAAGKADPALATADTAQVAGKRDLALADAAQAAGQPDSAPATADMAHAAGEGDLVLDDTGQVAGWHRAMLAAASSLLADAVRAGDVRADLDVRDLLTLVKGITLAAGDRRQAERLLSLVNWGP
ncbi:TetR/AcrR family transcriptional regulator [Nonomuraea rubra]